MKTLYLECNMGAAGDMPKKRVRRYPYREADLNLRKCMNTTTGIHTPMDIITMRG